MITTQFVVTDIQQTRAGQVDCAAITLAPPAPTSAALPGGIAYGPTQTPAPIRLAGLTTSDVVGLALGDTVLVSVSKVTA